MQCVVHMILRKGKISVALVFSHHKEKLILVTRSNGNHSILDFAFICHCLVLTVYGHFAFKCVVFLTLDTVLGVGVVCFSAWFLYCACTLLISIRKLKTETNQCCLSCACHIELIYEQFALTGYFIEVVQFMVSHRQWYVLMQSRVRIPVDVLMRFNSCDTFLAYCLKACYSQKYMSLHRDMSCCEVLQIVWDKSSVLGHEVPARSTSWFTVVYCLTLQWVQEVRNLLLDRKG